MQYALLGLFFAAFAAMLAGLIRPTLVLFGANRTRARAAAVYGSASIVLFLAVGAASMPEGRPPSTPASPEPVADTKQELVDDMTDLGLQDVALEEKDGRYVINAVYHPTSVVSAKLYVYDVANMLQKIGKRAAYSAVDTSSIYLLADAPGIDDYGNSKVTLAFALEIAQPHYGKINWSGIAPEQLLNLATVRTTDLGRAAARDFCADIDARHRAERFCKAFGY